MTNERLAKQLDYIHTTGFGVEIEMNSITRERAAGTAADFFGTERYENTARKNGYSTWSAWDAQGREWKFQKDVSITGPDSQKCELVTPILHYEDLENLQELDVWSPHPCAGDRPDPADRPDACQHDGKP